MKAIACLLLAHIAMNFASAADSTATERWGRISRAGKGVCVAKVKAGEAFRYVFFPGTNGPRYTSTLENAGVSFSSLAAAIDFAREKPTGVVAFFAPVRDFVDDAKILVEPTDAEVKAIGEAADKVERKPTKEPNQSSQPTPRRG